MKTAKQLMPDKVILTGRLSEFRDALQEEIDEIKNNGQNSTLLIGGHRIDAKDNGFWYRFFVEYMPLLPADTPCKLTIGIEQYDVTVISSSENEIIVSSKNKLPDNIGKAKLENGSTVLMERLIKCIEDNAEKKNPAGDRMFPDSDGNVYHVQRICSYDEIHYAKHSNEGQKKAVDSALQNDITYIWGPPGTGKTTVIATIINELYEHERSVLIVSHTNTAVDGAIAKVEKEYKYSDMCQDGQKAYPMLRLGASSDVVPDKAKIESHIDQLGKELVEKKETLEKQQNEIRHELEETNSILAKAAWLKRSNISEIKRINDIIDRLQEDKKSQEEQIGKAKDDLEKLFQENPDGAALSQMEEEYQSKVSAQKKVREEITEVKAGIDRFIHRIVEIEDEIKKYTRYDEYAQVIRQFMSSQFYKEKIFETESAINSLRKTLGVLQERASILQEAISKYDNKGSVAKFFTGKATYEQHLKSIKEINHSIKTNNESLQKKEKLLADYKKQLGDLQLLLEKQQAVKPTHTKNHWIDEKDRFSDALALAKSRKTVLEDEEKKLSLQIASIEYEKQNKQGLFDSVELLQNKIDKIQRSIDSLIKEIGKNRENLTERLNEERELCEQFYVLKSNDVHKLIKELSIVKDEVIEALHNIDIEEENKKKTAWEEKANQILSDLKEIQDKMAELEKQAIMNARIVGTTLAKSYLSDILRERAFDSVILDEASMASIPALWCAAFLAEKNIVIVGDFLQLPPIVMASTEMAQKWLGRDIFDHSGMQKMAKKENGKIRPANFVMLNEQFRMESDIAAIANLYYGRKYTMLRSNDMNPVRMKEREIFYSWYSGKRTKDHIHLIDTESLHAWVTGIPQAKGHSRLNSFSAAVDVALAFKCLEVFIEKKLYSNDDYKGTKVLIVAPYKPHVTLLNKLIEDEYQRRGISSEYGLVKAGTIHSFQGSEAEIVIFDLVIDEPHWKANLFISDPERNAALEKMFNVAVTRARFKLYIVGDFKYCQSRAKDNPLSELLKYLTDRYIKVDAKEQLLPKMFIPKAKGISLARSPKAESAFLTESTFLDYFVSDIETFKHSMIIYSPFMTEDRLSILLPSFYMAISHGKQIVVITKPLSERSKKELPQYEKCEKELKNIGVSILHKKGMHEKVILVDDDVIWTGSLNALSYTEKTVEVMERRKECSKDKAIINSYIKILDIEYLVKALASNYETKCPICHGEMLIAESESGGIFWKCINNDYTRNKEQQYPVDGILRCAKCDSTFVFSMKNQPRWVCKADPKHYQILRKNDLKLPQMAALLSKKEIKQVEEYFADLTKKGNE